MSSTLRSEERTVTTARGTQSSAQLTPHGGSSAEQMHSRNRSITIWSISAIAACALAVASWSSTAGITTLFNRWASRQSCTLPVSISSRRSALSSRA